MARDLIEDDSADLSDLELEVPSFTASCHHVMRTTAITTTFLIMRNSARIKHIDISSGCIRSGKPGRY